MSAVMKQDQAQAAGARRDAAIAAARAAFGGVPARHAMFVEACRAAEEEYLRVMRGIEEGDDVNNPLLLTAADTEKVFALIALAVDPQSSKQRLDQVVAAHADLEKAKVEHNEAAKRHDASKAELMAAREAHAVELAKARAAHDAECAARERSLDDREAKLAAREADAKRATEVAAATKAHFEKRAAQLREVVN